MSREEGVSFVHRAARVYYLPGMGSEAKDPAAVALGRKGGLARAKTLTAKQRRESARKASKAAAEARTAKAQKKKAAGK